MHVDSLDCKHNRIQKHEDTHGTPMLRSASHRALESILIHRAISNQGICRNTVQSLHRSAWFQQHFDIPSPQSSHSARHHTSKIVTCNQRSQLQVYTCTKQQHFIAAIIRDQVNSSRLVTYPNCSIRIRSIITRSRRSSQSKT